MAKFDPIAALESLDLEELEKQRDALAADLQRETERIQKKIDAVEVFIKAARLARDGKPPRKPREKKAKAIVETPTVTSVKTGGMPGV